MIAALYLAGTGAGLASFVALLVGLLAGLAWQFIALGALIFAYAYLCGVTVKHLKAHDDDPWLIVGVALVVVALVAVAAWKYLK